MKMFIYVTGLLLLNFPVYAAEDSQVLELGPVKIIGSSQEELTQPNSAHFVNQNKIEQQQQTDATRVLKQVPGVYVQEEDGQGLRPNIGLRGTHPHRSRKIVIMEDGILIGPAPYSAPAAYYTPFMSRIESLEVFKGVASVPYGPNSIGGAINYLTRSIPQGRKLELDAAGGSYEFRKLRGMAGYGGEFYGGLLEATRVSTIGFKELDGADSTGFKKNDVLLKLRYKLGGEAAMPQEISLKVGYSDEISDETYLGLTDTDFAKNPYRRYAASQLDQMLLGHHQVQATYKAEVSEASAAWVTLYNHEFHRDWRRLNQFRDQSATGRVLSDVIKNPTGTNADWYDVLTGSKDSSALGGNGADLVINNNDRYYFSRGAQLGWFQVQPISEELSNQVTLLGRFHEDQIRRNHTVDYFSMENKKLVSTGEARVQTTQNRDFAQSRSLSLSDEITWHQLKVTVNARYETVDFTNEDLKTNKLLKSSSEVFVPGVGALYQWTPQWSSLVSVNKGVTMVGSGQTESKNPEESVNYEFGGRYNNEDQQFFAEAIGFVSDYSNIKGTCSFSSGCSESKLDQEYDGGKAKIYGLETRLAKGLSFGKVYFPLSLNATFTQAKFDSSSESSNEDWGVGTIKSGDPMPYVPEAQYTLSLGTEYSQWSSELLLNWVGKMYDQSVEKGRRTIDAYGVVDYSLRYRYSANAHVYTRFDNLLDNEYLVSYRPFGARPGKARSVTVGVKALF